MNIIDGVHIAEQVLARLRKMPTPTGQLAALLVGDDSASLSFLKQKERTARDVGVHFILHQISGDLSQSELEQEVARIAADTSVRGIIVQLPLPARFDRAGVLARIPAEKDVDALNGAHDGVLAPAAGAVAEILHHIAFDPAGKRAVVLGAGLLIGKPVAAWLAPQVADLTILRSNSLDLSALGRADLVVTGTGAPGSVRGDQIKRGAVVIDFGYGRADGKVSGDIDAASCAERAGWLTPTPGGTGPVVVAKLFENFYTLNLTK